MDASNMVAHKLESYGVCTFSAKEMAFNILGLMHPLLFSIMQFKPIWANLNSGMDHLPNLTNSTTCIWLSLNKKSKLCRAIAWDNSADFQVTNGPDVEQLLQTVNVTPHANFRFDFPALESSESLADLSKLQGVINLEKVIIITGFAEVSLWGSSRTQWEMEARGKFTIEGCIKMVWMMGFIKHFKGWHWLPSGSLYVGWVDSKSSEPVDDEDVWGRYEKEILAHAGVRLIGKHFILVWGLVVLNFHCLFCGYNSSKKFLNMYYYQHFNLTDKDWACDCSNTTYPKTEAVHKCILHLCPWFANETYQSQTYPWLEAWSHNIMDYHHSCRSKFLAILSSFFCNADTSIQFMELMCT